MRKVLITSLACLFLFCLSFGKATVVTSNDKLDTNILVWIPCALGGAGEFVLLTGTLHVTTHTTIDSANNVHVSAHFQPQKLKGVGQTSGDKYNGTGVTRWNYKFGGVNFPLYIMSEVNNFKIIGQGPGNNYRVHWTLHITINANGIMTANVSNVKIDCK